MNPILESAGNLGYTDVKRVQNSDGDWEYVRTFDDTEIPTAFGSFPDVEWGNVPGDLLNLLQVGVEQAIEDGIEGEPTTNALAALLGLLGLNNLTSLGGGSGLGLSSITDLAEGLVGNALGSSFAVAGSSARSPEDNEFRAVEGRIDLDWIWSDRASHDNSRWIWNPNGNRSRDSCHHSDEGAQDPRCGSPSGPG